MRRQMLMFVIISSFKQLIPRYYTISLPVKTLLNYSWNSFGQLRLIIASRYDMINFTSVIQMNFFMRLFFSNRSRIPLCNSISLSKILFFFLFIMYSQLTIPKFIRFRDSQQSSMMFFLMYSLQFFYSMLYIDSIIKLNMEMMIEYISFS